MRQSKTTVIIYPRKDKLSSKNGRIPIYVRVLANAKKAEMRTNIDITVEEYSKWDPNMMRINDRFSLSNAEINKIDMILYEIIKSFQEKEDSISAKQICSMVNIKKSRVENIIIDSINDYYLKFIQHNKELSEGTKSNYRKAIKHMITFLKINKLEDIVFSLFDLKLAQDFKNYLTNNDILNGRKGMIESSASCIIKKFRTIFEIALERGLIYNNPFKKIKIKTKSAPREKLTIHHIAAIKNAQNLSENEIIYRDIFLFSSFTGLSYIDAINLKTTNINKEDSNYKLTIHRTKTSHPAEQYLVNNALEIINKYKNDLSVIINNGIIPRRSNKEINYQLKHIATKVGISIRLSHHIARHSFRQLLAEAGVEDMGVIKRMMGHSRQNDIDSVYYSITDSRLLEAKNKFELYLTKYLSYTNVHGK